MPALLLAPVSYGELIDKWKILEIKLARISDQDKRINVARELDALREAWHKAFGDGFGVAAELVLALKHVNETLWDIEDAIRSCERDKTFDDDFIRLARAVYITNDERASLKRRINVALGSGLVEEKSYHAYDGS